MARFSTAQCLRRGDITLVFGLEWFPLLGEQPEAQARRLARQRRAAHFVVAEGTVAAAGLLRERMRRERGTHHHSAAALFAVVHPTGAVAAVLPCGGQRYWLVAVHEGAVMTRTDQFHTDAAELDAALAMLREAHPALMLLHYGDDADGLLDALFNAAREHGAGLVSVRALNAGRPKLAVAAACVLGAAVWAGDAYRSAARRQAQAAVPDAAAAWRTAVTESARPHRVHGVAGLERLLDALYEAPATVGGWALTQIDCRPAGLHWSCYGRYRREHGSDNLDFLAEAHSDWQVSFEPMQQAVASWRVAVPFLPLESVALRRPQQNEAWFVSALQAMLPAFNELRLETPQALPLRVPLDAAQRPLERPANLAQYRRRLLRVQAPLRSLSLLLPEAAHLSWERVELHVVPVDTPTVLNSSLRVSLTGVLYEIDRPDAHSAAHAGADARAG